MKKIIKIDDSEYQRKYHKKNKVMVRDKHRVYMRKWRINNPLKAIQYRKRNKHNNSMRKYANNHFRKILLNKNAKCKKCGNVKMLEMHHNKYTKNIKDIVVLCVTCHKVEHRAKKLNECDNYDRKD